MLLLLLACAGKPDDTATNDRDADGVPDADDCAPDDPASGAPPRQYVDADGDGYGNAAVMERACPGTPGYSEDGTDCDDQAASVYPGAPEVWYDGADEDCAGDSDFDQDHDGRDHPVDCDDRDPAIPAAAEDCATPGDDNCDGTVNEVDAPGCVPLYEDADGDGYGTGPVVCQCAPEGEVRATVDGDCDDADAARFPGAFERCDGRQNACDGEWGKESELGVVTRYEADGAVTDATPAWAGGRRGSPAAITLPADAELHVCPGTFYVRLTAAGEGHGATVQGHLDGGAVVLDGGGGRVVTLVDPLGPTFTLTDLVLQGGAADEGGGILAGDVDLTLRRVTVYGNVATSSGGGVYTAGGSLTLEDTRITGNSAPAGAGLFLYDTTTVASGQIDANTADRAAGAYGGGLVWYGITGASLDLTDLVVSDNLVTSSRGEAWAGGIYAEEQAGAAVTIAGLTLTGNVAASAADASLAGGAYLRAGPGPLAVADSYVAGNAAVGVGPSYGGGLDIYSDGGSPSIDLQRVVVTSNVVQGDSSSAGGGMAVGLAGTIGTLTDVTVSYNSVLTTAGAYNGTGGGLTIGATAGSLQLDTVAVRGNAAGTGAGAMVWGGSGATIDIAQSSFDDNVSGGGLMYIPSDDTAVLEVAGTSADGNDFLGFWVYAPTGTLATVAFTGRGGADTDLAGNVYGLALSCGEIGGACDVSGVSLDFQGVRGSNSDCDLYYDGTCASRLGDDVALDCGMAGSIVACGW